MTSTTATAHPTSPATLTPALSTPADELPTMSTVRIRLTLLGVMLGMLLAMLDNTIVGTALPTIVGDLGGLAHLSWVVTAYTLATAISTPVWGKVGDLRGRKNVFLAAIAVFVTGSALSGLAQSMVEMIAFRAVQGIGAGGLAVGAFALIADLVAPRERGRYQGMTATVMAVGTIGGPLLGGVVTTQLGWRWAFYVNVPLGLAALAWCMVMLQLPAKRVPARIDWLGTVLLAMAISGLVLDTTWAGSRYAWLSPQTLGLAILTAAALSAFVMSQRRVSEPLLPLRIFGSLNVSLMSAIALVVGVAMFGCVVYLPQFQQSVQHADATSSGLLLLPLLLPVVLASQVVGRVMSKTGRYKIFPVLGTASITAGMALLATMTTTTSRATTSVYMALIGIGLGFTMQMTTIIAQNGVAMQDVGVASAAVTLFRTLGGSVGVALFGSLFTRALAGASTGSESTPTAEQLTRMSPVAQEAYLHGVALGAQHIFAAGAVISVAACIAAVFIKETPLRGKPGAHSASTGAAKAPVGKGVRAAMDQSTSTTSTTAGEAA